MKARDLFERSFPAPMAPHKPGTQPGIAPARPAPGPAPSRFPNPFRRRRSPGVQPGPMPKPKARADEGVKDWVAGKLDLAKEVVRPNQSGSYRKFRAKELLGLDKSPEQTPLRRAQAKSLFKR